MKTFERKGIEVEHLQWTQGGRLLRDAGGLPLIWNSGLGQANTKDEKGLYQPYLLSNENKDIKFGSMNLLFGSNAEICKSDGKSLRGDRATPIEKKVEGKWSVLNLKATDIVNVEKIGDKCAVMSRKFECSDGEMTLKYTISPQNKYKMDVIYKSNYGGEYRVRDEHRDLPAGDIVEIRNKDLEGKEFLQFLQIGTVFRTGFPKETFLEHYKSSGVLNIVHGPWTVEAGQSFELDLSTWNDKAIASGNDDARYHTTVWNYTGAAIYIGHFDNPVYSDGYFRWVPDVDITGSIDSAIITFISTAAKTGTINMRIYGIDVDNVGDLSTDRHDEGTYPSTTAYTDWTISANWSIGTAYATPDFNQSDSGPLTEMLASGYALGTSKDAFCIRAKCITANAWILRDLAAYENATYAPAEIDITYTPAC